MKLRTPYALVLLCALIVTSAAQSQTKPAHKPAIFKSFPDKISCSITELSKVFSTSVNQNINLPFSDDFLISGVVTTNVIRYANLQSVVIKSPLFGDAVFTISKISKADNSVEYVGRIISNKYSDGYELKKDQRNNYQLVKIETNKVMQDCSHN